MVLSRNLQVIHAIERCYNLLVYAPSRKPGPSINKVFTDLVHTCTVQCTQQDATEILANPVIERILHSLRALCAEGEFLLEVYWAERLIESPRLQDFPNFRNYDLLVKLEANCLRGVGAKLGKLVFVGSGPLPLTSLLFSTHIEDAVVNIDRSSEAICLSRALTKALGEQDKIQFWQGDAMQYPDYGNADVVILAALVGSTPKEKEAMLRRISSTMRQGAHLMVRSTHRLRTILYAPAQDIFMDDLDPLVEVHPTNEVINSIIVFQKRKD
ncbi:nicotianamine synthase [Dichotomocladium elegans]|nr:nicotianamine synthase [Dichotomocladium elegans]